jgi:hypothetical protein
MKGRPAFHNGWKRKVTRITGPRIQLQGLVYRVAPGLPAGQFVRKFVAGHETFLKFLRLYW